MQNTDTWIERYSAFRSVIIDARITEAMVDEWEEKVKVVFPELSKKLPDGHAWRTGKLEHGLAAKQLALGALGGLLGLNNIEARVIGFLLLSHDIGRLVEADCRQRSEPCGPHGALSAMILGDILPTSLFDFRYVLLLAIEHHSDLSTPSVREVQSSQSAWALTALLRDLDKMAGFEKAAKYVGDEDEKARQRIANWSKERQTDSTWGDEKGEIVPSSALSCFLTGQPIDRQLCQSYEAYMLQLLGWLHDVTHPEIRRLIVRDGGPARVMKYLEDQLLVRSPGQLREIRTVYDRLIQ